MKIKRKTAVKKAAKTKTPTKAPKATKKTPAKKAKTPLTPAQLDLLGKLKAAPEGAWQNVTSAAYQTAGYGCWPTRSIKALVVHRFARSKDVSTSVAITDAGRKHYEEVR